MNSISGNNRAAVVQMKNSNKLKFAAKLKMDWRGYEKRTGGA